MNANTLRMIKNPLISHKFQEISEERDSIQAQINSDWNLWFEDAEREILTHAEHRNLIERLERNQEIVRDLEDRLNNCYDAVIRDDNEIDWHPMHRHGWVAVW